jgi:signal transduction histidine kinase
MKRTPANPPLIHSDETQRRGALVLQTLPILLIPVFVAVVTFFLLRLSIGGQFEPRSDPSGPPGGPLIPIVVLVVFFSALIILVRLGRPTISALLLIGAWTLVMALGALRSGVTSFFPALLIIPICAAGLLIDWVACVSLAGLATLLVGSLAWLETRGLLHQPLPPQIVDDNLPFLAVGFWVAIFATVAALTSLLAGGLQRALRQSRAQAQALQDLSGQLEARVEAQTTQILEQERQAATLAERARLAREIHDTLAQGLTGIVVQLGAAQRAQAAASDASAEHIELAQRMAREALAEARRSVWNLRAPALERGSLADALRSIVARPIRPEQTTVFQQRGEPWPLTQEVEAALLRMAQEALANAAKHAEATHVEVLLAYTLDSVRLSIADNGVGFDQAALSDGTTPSPAGGFGLLGIRERIGALGGTLELRNGDGAQVVVTLPREKF